MATPIQQQALRLGLVLVGIFCLYGAWQQLRQGVTFGLAGNPRISREENPGWFLFLLVARCILGTASVGAGMFFSG